jgi:hypothetical protein
MPFLIVKFIAHINIVNLLLSRGQRKTKFWG